jgi:hypothetical protein
MDERFMMKAMAALHEEECEKLIEYFGDFTKISKPDIVIR